MNNDQLGPFLLLEKIGEGGMGIVYQARDTRLDRIVAIKVLPESRVADPERRARFMQEARAASALNHPNIVTIHDIAEHEGRYFLVMEYINGSPLNERIPRKGMPVVEALRIGVQVADALAAAHAAGIVHRDLKPGNIMVDDQGRAKVLDFGLAKLGAKEPSTAIAAGDETRTVGPLTEEGAIVGSIPYMSPEQAEGKPVDARSDIFSFGAVLYEMFSGQRAFQGESRVSTLAAVVEREPRAISEAAPGVPVELERIITRCLRKDVARRSQHMSDVRLALEELREESESGKLVRPVAVVAAAPVRAACWPLVVAGVAVLIAAGALVWATRGRSQAPAAPAALVRVTADDGNSYRYPVISRDGKFIAALSKRGGTTNQVWLQQVGGGDAIQVTHAPAAIGSVYFFPDGTRLIYDTAGSIETIPTLGGTPRTVVKGNATNPLLSPDGRLVAYHEGQGTEHNLVITTIDGGSRTILDKWNKTQGVLRFETWSWMPDSKSLIVSGTMPGDKNLESWDWFLLPINGGDAIPMKAGPALRAAGIAPSWPLPAPGNLLFTSVADQRSHVWRLPFDYGSHQITGSPSQITFGTDAETPGDVSADGTVAVEIRRVSADFYLLPLEFRTGKAAAPIRRLTADGRAKQLWGVGGDPGYAYFYVIDSAAKGISLSAFSLEFATAQQRTLFQGQSLLQGSQISADGKQIAYSVPQGNSYDIHVGEVGAAPETARKVCSACGDVVRFSHDARYLMIRPEGRPGGSQPKASVALLEVATGKITPSWLADPTRSVGVGIFAGDWLLVSTNIPGDNKTVGSYAARFDSAPIPRSEWTEVKLPEGYSYSLTDPYIYWWQAETIMGSRFDTKQKRFGDPFPVTIPSGSALIPKPGDRFYIRGANLMFLHNEETGSIWLCKVPR